MAKSPVAIIILDGFGWRPDVDGALVGGASLEAESFLALLEGGKLA